MDSKTENVSVMDCNTVANGIMRDINDIDSMERMLSSELSSEDLLRIDCAILSSLRNTTDFSRDLLKQLEENNFHAPIVEKNEKVVSKSIDKVSIATSYKKGSSVMLLPKSCVFS